LTDKTKLSIRKRYDSPHQRYSLFTVIDKIMREVAGAAAQIAEFVQGVFY